MNDQSLIEEYNPEWQEKLSVRKRELCEKYSNDRQSYIDRKTEMVQQVIRRAPDSISS